MKRIKHRNIIFFFLAFGFLSRLEAQEKIYLPLLVNEFRNINESGNLFYRDRIGEDDRTGNDLVFDPSGKAFIYQWERDQIYELNSKYQVAKVILLLNKKSRDVRRLIKADGTGFLFFNFYGIESYFNYQGEILFQTDIYDLMQEPVTSVDYLSNILFLVDRKGRLYSVYNPTMDQGENYANYRNPEQTKLLFKSNSGIDLQGLTIDEKGLMYLNNIFIGPNFMPVVGQWQYYLNQNSIVIGNVQTNLLTIPMPKLESSEILECTAIHPSGDIYFLRFNKALNKHILYKIENNWDLEVKLAWERPKK